MPSTYVKLTDSVLVNTYSTLAAKRDTTKQGHLGCIAKGDALLVQHWDYGRSGPRLSRDHPFCVDRSVEGTTRTELQTGSRK